MGEFLLGLFIVLVVVGIFQEKDELDLERKKLEQERKRHSEYLRRQRDANEIEIQKLRSLRNKIKHEVEVKKKKQEEYLTLDQVIRYSVVILLLAVFIILFFKVMYLNY